MLDLFYTWLICIMPNNIFTSYIITHHFITIPSCHNYSMHSEAHQNGPKTAY